MKNFLIEPLKGSKAYTRLLENIENSNSPILTYGIIKENIGHINYGLNRHLNRQTLIVSYDEKRARAIYEDIKSLGYDDVEYFPRKRIMLYNIDAVSNEENNKRLEILSRLERGDNLVVVTTFESIFDKLISKPVFKELSLKIDYDSIVDLDTIRDVFVTSGYERVVTVESIGQFSIRGGIIDFFSPDRKHPVRIELFDNEVDSIREYDELSQRSIKNLDQARIVPAKEILILDEDRESILKALDLDLEKRYEESKLSQDYLTKVENKFLKLKMDIEEKVHLSNRDILIPYIPEESLDYLVDYFQTDSIVYVDEPERLEEAIGLLEEDFNKGYEELYHVGEVLPKHREIMEPVDQVRSKLMEKIYIENTSILTGKNRLEAKDIVKFTCKSGQSYHKKIDLLLEDLKHYRDSNYRTIILSGNKERGTRLSKNLRDRGFENIYTDNLDRDIAEREIIIVAGSLQGGIEYPEDRFVIINDKDVFGGAKRPKKKKDPKEKKASISFTDLREGDYVVHENHGIGRYEGVEQLDIQGIKKDYLNIRYRDGDKLYVPIDQMNLIQKYIGTDNHNPKINKLSSAEWTKTKARAKKAVEEMAVELIELYARRENLEGHQFKEDTQWQKEFEDYFPYEETDGQLRSIKEIKMDMEGKKPMDRLLCGDVGYGKTEVALRAVFKAVMEGKQVAFLVPTTILAQQHYKTIIERFSNYPINIAMLSRFRTKNQQEEDIRKIKKGLVDIVVGTHRILSQDVKFKDLGLLVIDEEQRFGVKDKEKLKQLKENVDVLTLTATPIPRTLHMSLSGIRDMSVLDEPPEERYPVQTYVLEFNPQMIRDAILKEISRGGQVYFVYNRVKDIDEMAIKLKELVPEASFLVAHGQMGEKKLERRMMMFSEREYDVLVCTTIIETGLDLPNVNTIIIYDSDYMGLSQLYQLKGRVGRSDRIAYSYFTYKENKILSEIAERRLLAIREFTEFGSGFKIAMRDLEIRGAGNLLGEAQHGQIEAIGYDLYVKILHETIRELQGEEIEKIVDTIVDLEKDGYIPDKYIGNVDQKVEIYKKIAALSTEDEMDELLDELMDRFGDLPRPVSNLMDISYIRSLASRNNIRSIIQSSMDVNIIFDDPDLISNDVIQLLGTKYSYRVSFNRTKDFGFKYRAKKDVLMELKELLANINKAARGELEEE